MAKTMDFRQKEVINVCDGRRLGYIGDVDIDFESGTIKSIIVPISGGLFGFGGGDELIIPWKKISRIGVDTILVEIEPSRNKKYQEVG